VPAFARIGPVTDPLAAKRGRFLALAAGLPERCRLVEASEGGSLSRKLRKLTAFGGRYLRWAGARAGLKPGRVDFPLFWGKVMNLPYADDADFVTFYLAGVPGGPEYKLVRWFIRNLKEGDVFYDAGANYGFYTALAAEFVGETGQVHAFEPLPEIHEELVRNFGATAVRAVDAALWDKSGEATLYRHRLSDAFNTLEAEVTDFDKTRGGETTTVRCLTLDEYAKANKPPTVIKIDVEGGEKRLIAGAAATFRAAKPVVAMEVWAGEGGERFSLPAARALLDLGYDAFALSEDGGAAPLAPDALPAFLRGLAVWDNLVFKPRP
jgi:FkbM family methyltransferase